jgi:hypothetical protein
MSDPARPPLPDADRSVSDVEDDVDPEAPADSTAVHPPRDDGDRPVPSLEQDPDDLLQEENAATSLDQPSDQSS